MESLSLKENDRPGRGHAITRHQHEKDGEGYGHVHQGGSDDAGGDEKVREIDFRQQVLLVHQGRSARAAAGGEEHPRQDSRVVEQRIGDLPRLEFRRQLAGESRHGPEDHGLNDDVEDGLNDGPGGPEHRLLVPHLHVAPDEEVQKLAIVHQFVKIDRDPAMPGSNLKFRSVRRLRWRQG